jgi:outer membrane protein assembly factor BamD (BamD/ComL family)
MTPEEKTAVKISNLLADLQLDIGMVGFYFGQNAHSAVYNRFEVLVESAKNVQSNKQDRVNKIISQ